VHKDVQHTSADLIFRSMLPPYEQSLFPQGRLNTFHEYYGTGRVDHRRTKQFWDGTNIKATATVQNIN